MRLVLALMIVVLIVAYGCARQPGQTKVQTERERMGLQAKNAQAAFRACLKQAKTKAGSTEIGEAKIIQGEADPRYTQKLNDPNRATPEEARAALEFSVARRPCLTGHIENLSRFDVQLGLLRSEAAAASDKDLLDLASGQITWGQLNRREQERGEELRRDVQTITQRMVAGQGNQTETDTQLAQQQQTAINQQLRGWYDTQSLVNAELAQSASIVECLVRDNKTICR
jgi:hypothetical protein